MARRARRTPESSSGTDEGGRRPCDLRGADPKGTDYFNGHEVLPRGAAQTLERSPCTTRVGARARSWARRSPKRSAAQFGKPHGAADPATSRPVRAPRSRSSRVTPDDPAGKAGVPAGKSPHRPSRCAQAMGRGRAVHPERRCHPRQPPPGRARRTHQEPAGQPPEGRVERRTSRTFRYQGAEVLPRHRGPPRAGPLLRDATGAVCGCGSTRCGPSGTPPAVPTCGSRSSAPGCRHSGTGPARRASQARAR